MLPDHVLPAKEGTAGALLETLFQPAPQRDQICQRLIPFAVARLEQPPSGDWPWSRKGCLVMLPHVATDAMRNLCQCDGVPPAGEKRLSTGQRALNLMRVARTASA
jgi:hypothetical protein